MTDETDQIMTSARDLCRAAALWPEARGVSPGVLQKLGSLGKGGSIITYCRSDPRMASTHEDWDSDNWLLGTPKGVIDLKTGKMRPATKEDHVSLCTAVSPEPGEPTEWLKYMDATHRGNQNIISFLQRFLGYSLTGEVIEHALIFAFGTGRNGKGVMMDTIIHILGDYALAAPISVFAQQKYQQHSTEIAQLRGKRFVTSEEPSTGLKWDEGRIKWLTGGGTVTARKMRQDDVSFDATWKLMFAGNAIPSLSRVDVAIKERFHIVPFTRTFADHEKDPMLREKLKAEAGRILQWLIDGCLAWQKHGLAVPEECRVATEEYMVGEDSMQEFLDECCDAGPNLYVQSSTLYKRYRDWAESQGEEVMSQKAFTSEISLRPNIFKKKVMSGTRIIGISLKDS